jgi:hypothetical protein
MAKRPFQNRMNDMDPKEWIKFQKSWFIHDPPRRRKEVLRHPAKFPETMVQEFIEFFTKRGETVFDPMVGTGSTLIASLRSGRNSIGIELNPTYATIAKELVKQEREDLGSEYLEVQADVIAGDASELADFDLPVFDYVITSESDELDVVYSEDPADLGNISDYDEFFERLVAIYSKIQPHLKPRGYITIIVKNIKKGGRIYPLAWDLGKRLGEIFTLKDEKIWCQDDIRLAPYGMGNAWVSNTFHHYCLQFRNEPDVGCQSY